MTDVVKNQKETFLVFSFVFFAFWEFFYGFLPFEGGGWGEFFKSIHATSLIRLFLFLILFSYLKSQKKVFDFSSTNQRIVLIFVLCYPFYFYHSFLKNGLIEFISWFISLINLSLFFFLRNDIRVRILDCFIKCFGYLMLFSLIEYFVYQITGQYFVLYSSLKYSYQIMDQSIFNMIPIDRLWGFGRVYRFQSLAVEPGNVGTTCGFLLFATSNCRKYRLQYIVFWFAGTMSFSLAFFVLALIHLAFSMSNQKSSIMMIWILLVLFWVLYYNFKDAFDLLFFDRISNPTRSAGNRSSEGLDWAFLQSWRDGSLWMGKGLSVEGEIDGAIGAGAKVAIYFHGIIPIFLLIIAYVNGYLQKLRVQPQKKKKSAMAFFFVFWLSYYQRHFITPFDMIMIYFTMPVFMTYKEQLISGQFKTKFIRK